MIYDFNEQFTRIMSEKWTYDSVVNGCKVMPMGVADMDLVSPIEVREAIYDVVMRREFGYPAYHPDYKKVLADWYDRHYNWRPDEDIIVETPGMLLTMGTFIRDMTAPNEKTVLMSPVYHSFKRAINDNHRETVDCDLICGPDNYYTIDFDSLRETCARPDSKFLILCNPHNPVGRCWTKEEIVKIIDICHETNTILISDEIHGDFTYDMTYTPVLSVAEDKSGIIMFSSGGKLFNIGGIFSAFIMTHDEALKKQIGVVIKELHFQPTAFAHEAAYAGFKYGYDYREQLKKHIRAMQTIFCEGLNKMPYPVKCPLPEATYLVWADFRETGWSADRIHEFLYKDAAIGCNRGDMFGPAGAGFARINCAVCEAKIHEALRRIEHAFRMTM